MVCFNSMNPEVFSVEETPEELYQIIRSKFHIPQEQFEVICRMHSAVIAGLQKQNISITEMQKILLLKKMSVFMRGGNSCDEDVLVHLLLEDQTVINDRGLLLKDALQKFLLNQRVLHLSAWEDISETDGVPMIIEATLQDGAYYLGRLFTREHFKQTSAVLEHCLERASLDRYFQKSKSEAIKVFGIYNAISTLPVVTIVYDADKKCILQIRHTDDNLLTGSEPYFDATIEALSHLVTKKEYTTTGLPISREVRRIQDLESVARGTSEVFLESGTFVSFMDAIESGENILGGSTLHVDETFDAQVLQKIAESVPLSIDMTHATATQRACLLVVTGTLIDNREHVSGYDSLACVQGQILCNQAQEIVFETLQETQRGFYAEHAIRVVLPSITKINGRLDVPQAEVVSCPILEVVAGNIDAPEIKLFKFPQLRHVNWNICISGAEYVECPHLEFIGGVLMANNASRIITPQLKYAREIICKTLTEIISPQVQTKIVYSF